MRLRRNAGARHGLSPALGLLLLSALWAVAWLRADLFPQFGANTVPLALRQAILFCVFVVVAGPIAVARRAEFPRGRSAWACAAFGLMLFVVPAALAAFAQDYLSSLDRVAVFSLTPVFAVVLEPYLQGGEPRRGRAALAGALAAVAGILCLFPLDIPGTWTSGAALCALLAAALSIAAANCVAVRLARALAARSVLPMAVLAAGASFLCFATAAVFTPQSAWNWPALPAQLLGLLATDLPALFLLFWLMRHLAASRMTARFFLAPLFAILLGMMLQPSAPPLRAWLGIALLALGAGWLVFAPAEKGEAEELMIFRALADTSLRRPPPAD